MNCSIHKEMQLIVDHGGNEEVSDLKYWLTALRVTNQTVA